MRGYGTSRRNYLADTQMRIIIIWENRRGRASGSSTSFFSTFTRKFVTVCLNWVKSFIAVVGAAAPVRSQ